MVSNGIIHDLFNELETALAESCASPLFTDGAPTLVYGAGNAGKDVFRLLSNRRIPVRGFLDRQAKPGSAWDGISIRQPDDPSLSVEMRSQAHVVIGIFNAGVAILPIVRMLKGLGYARVTTFLDLHDHFPAELGDRFWLTARSFYRGRESETAAANKLWSDDKSRDLYAAILRFRFTKDYGVLPNPEAEQQYLPADVPPWPVPLRFIDCGAYDGDTLAILLKRNLKVEALAGFEPDPKTFIKLSEYVRAHSASFPDTTALFPCGVDAATAQLRFASGQDTGSHISAGGDTFIQSVSVDEALPNFRPNLIKMDIEGAEDGALRGARRVIAEHRPGLAVCVYHRPADLWQIPLRIRAITGDGGKFYLRLHGFSGLELVCYWVPS